jgi:hypothetical protein
MSPDDLTFLNFYRSYYQTDVTEVVHKASVFRMRWFNGTARVRPAVGSQWKFFLSTVM